jgi:hypothetical protein
MLDKHIAIRCFYRPKAEDPHERRHAEIYENFKDFPYPFNFPIGQEAPDFGRKVLIFSRTKHEEVNTLSFSSSYNYRYNGAITNDIRLANYDQLEIKFGHNKLEIDYHKALFELFPKVVELYGGCRAEVLIRNIWIRYQDQFEEFRKSIVSEGKVDFDGKDHIFNLHPAQHWSNDLCKKALGYDAKEAIKRLEKAGALLAIPVLDGVYCVLNDNRDLELEEFTEMNNKFKQALGINDGTYPTLISKFKLW